MDLIRIETVTFEKLSVNSREALRLHVVRMIRLPPMHVLTSRLKSGQVETIEDNIQSLFVNYGFSQNPGLRNSFYRKEPSGEWMMLIKIPSDYEDTTIYADEILTGGLFAIASSFMEDMDDTIILLRDCVNNSDHYEPDVNPEEELHRYQMLRKFYHGTSRIS